jgi:hypothetical protein
MRSKAGHLSDRNSSESMTLLWWSHIHSRFGSESYSTVPGLIRLPANASGIWRGARCAWPPCAVEEGCGQSTPQCAPHIQGVRSPPDKKITSAAAITTRLNRALSRLKFTTRASNSASSRIRVTLVIVVINSILRPRHDSEPWCLFSD